MTTVAWDGRTLAADKQTTFGGLRATTTKVHRINGNLIACAGIAAQIAEFLVWFEAGAKPADMPASQRDTDKSVDALVVRPDGAVVQYGNTPHPIPIEDRQFAIGSGRDYALAAMYLGKTAREAVEVAAVFDPSTGNGVDELTLEPAALHIVGGIA